MTNTFEKIENCFHQIIEYDWDKFNSRGMAEQGKEWEQLKNNFKKIIQEDYKKGGLDFKEIYEFLKPYDGKFRSLPIEGKVYVAVNKVLLYPQLFDIVKEIEYEDVSMHENLDCECELLSRFRKNPALNNLKKIGIINDHYYMPELYLCKKCGFKWISFVADDSVGMTVFEKFSPEDEHLVEYD